MPLYVYAITSESHPLRLDDVSGVGDPPTTLYTVGEGSLRAVVSDAPEDLAAGRRDLEAHHTVQGRLWGEGTTLPLSFGFVAPDEDTVRAVLRERGEEFSRALDELSGRVEFNVKAVQNEEALLREVLAGSEQARRLNEATRDGGGTYEDRLALGQLVAQEVQARQESLAAEIVEALRPLTRSEQLSPPSQQYFLNVSFLVDDDKAEEFSRTGAELAERYGEVAELRVRGPLPPYSFA
ncbi:GvpL/GvpF family gas vesicle protein [Streptomyces sp. SCA3-4]|uniref:GvpL/GvpF family gas vesicle protein n=1 Tax=Streptomyces sichuanensis TaxID=2871810 RepID=UPI001CE38E1D|nr:GvpL/GvpF family gas vesicle protein [Streptomyces sichuanensis]MCA6093255.1 GvpL/GvpF family gas vesicle protein [Streptomyces sichuanensis]